MQVGQVAQHRQRQGRIEAAASLPAAVAPAPIGVANASLGVVGRRRAVLLRLLEQVEGQHGVARAGARPGWRIGRAPRKSARASRARRTGRAPARAPRACSAAAARICSGAGTARAGPAPNRIDAAAASSSQRKRWRAMAARTVISLCPALRGIVPVSAHSHRHRRIRGTGRNAHGCRASCAHA